MYRGRADLSDCRPCLLFIGLLVLSTFMYRCKKPELSREGYPATAGLNPQAKNGATSPSKNQIRSDAELVIAPGGTISEYCDRKDCVHYQYSLTAFAYAAELARIQGDNSIWTANGNLLSAGYDYQRTAYGGGGGCQYCSTSSPVFPGVEVAYNYYKTGNLGYLSGLQAPLGVPNDNTFLGFTTYTHYNVPGL